ncbi:MAG: hypothetical protein DCF16_06470 [Alphaproteobacteria bacterium]|nr:MAG: hypothetical protein DCF16_06470 [Alphaproteobacteria bacterium]
MRVTILLAAALALGACATGGASEPAGAPSFVVSAGEPAPAQARFLTQCVSASIADSSFDREANVLRFHCNGAPAREFYDALASWSPGIGAEYQAEGRTWRFTTPIEENPSFRDYCTFDGARHECTVVLNVGEFLEQPAR